MRSRCAVQTVFVSWLKIVVGKIGAWGGIWEGAWGLADLEVARVAAVRLVFVAYLFGFSAVVDAVGSFGCVAWDLPLDLDL